MKRSTDLPLYYGCKDKDMIAAHLFIERITKATTLATWDDARKIKFYMCLRDKAIIWWESLQDDDVDLDDWEVKKAFKPKYSAQMTCANFTDLIQKPGKTINDYHIQVQTAFKRLTDISLPPWLLSDWPVLPRPKPKTEGMNYMAKFFKHQLFLAGLSDSLRNKVLEAKKDSLAQSLEFARELEAIQLDHKRSQKIAAVKAELLLEDGRTSRRRRSSKWPQFGLSTTGSHPRRMPAGRLASMGRPEPTGSGTRTSPAVIVKRKATCRKNVTPTVVTMSQMLTPMANHMETTVSTLWLTTWRTGMPTRSTRTPSGLYYKTITIVIDAPSVVKSDAPNCSITY
jgi:hypothetical protein